MLLVALAAGLPLMSLRLRIGLGAALAAHVVLNLSEILGLWLR